MSEPYSEPNPRIRLARAAIAEALSLDEVKTAIRRAGTTPDEVVAKLLGGGLQLPPEIDNAMDEYAKLDDYRQHVEQMIRSSVNPWRTPQRPRRSVDLIEKVVAPLWFYLFVVVPYLCWDGIGEVFQRRRRRRARQQEIARLELELNERSRFGGRSDHDYRDEEVELDLELKRLRARTQFEDSRGVRSRIWRSVKVVLLVLSMPAYVLLVTGVFIAPPVLGLLGRLSWWYSLPAGVLLGLTFALGIPALALRASHNRRLMERSHTDEGLENEFRRKVQLFSRADSIVEEDPDYRAASAQLEDLGRVIQRELLERSVLPAIRNLLRLDVREAANPLEFLVVSARGLGEIDDERFQIETSSMLKLMRTLRQLPGGSVGLSGPRGVGKTTILRAITSSVGENMWEERILPVRLSAPVDYVPVEFISLLATELCRAILGPVPATSTREATEGAATAASTAEEPADRATPAGGGAPPEQRRSRVEGSRLLRSPWPWRALTLLLLARSYAEATAQIGSAVTDATSQRWIRYGLVALCVLLVLGTAAVGRMRKSTRVSVWTWLGLPYLLLTTAAAGAVWLEFGDRVRRALPALDPWIPLAVVAILLVALYLVLRRWVAPDAVRSGDPVAARPPVDGGGQSSLPAGLKGEAELLLYSLQFVESNQSGTSSKLTMGAGAGIELKGELSDSSQRTLSRREMSMPELVARLRQLIELATAHRRVLVTIDELDKIADESDARRFLNDIKAIFGVYRSYFVVAVSRDAMVSFERRGLAIRTEIDSAFDEVIDAGHMTIEETRQFLTRRVEGLTEPFIQLCYCLSGGLPRDVIRTMRSIVNAGLSASSARVYLPRVTKVVVLDEMSRYAAATLSRRDIEDSEWPLDVFTALSALRSRSLHPSKLTALADAAVAAAPRGDGPAPSNHVRWEVQVMLRYYAEVFDLFTSRPTSFKAFRARVEELAQARRDMAQNLYFAAQAVGGVHGPGPEPVGDGRAGAPPPAGVLPASR